MERVRAISSGGGHHDRVGLLHPRLPLDQAVGDQGTFPGMDGCDTGWCMT